MIRSRFNELCAYLKTKLPFLGVAAEQFDASLETLTAAEGGHEDSTRGTHLCNFRYRASIAIERLPLDKLPLLVCFCRAWLDDHDDTRGDWNLPDPEFSVIPLDNATLIDVIGSFDFVDPVHISESETPAPDAIEWNGKTWDASEFLFDVAERGEVNHAPTDV